MGQTLHKAHGIPVTYSPGKLTSWEKSRVSAREQSRVEVTVRHLLVVTHERGFSGCLSWVLPYPTRPCLAHSRG